MLNHHALNLINALARDEAALRGQEFLAPLERGGRARLRVRGLIYELAIADAQPGWWICQALDAQRAAVIAAALPWQPGEYLSLWPALRLALIEPLHQARGHAAHTEGEGPHAGVAPGAWLALPYNPSDAAQRFGLSGPLVVRLVEGGQPFERVIGRVEGATVWYDQPDRRADPTVAEELRAALAAGAAAPEIAGLGPGERAAYALLATRRAAAQSALLEDRRDRRLRDMLAIGGAQLLGYEVVGDTLRITWEREGHRSVTLVNAGLDVISAGVCLSGDDARFDLASIVGVVAAAPDYARQE